MNKRNREMIQGGSASKIKNSISSPKNVSGPAPIKNAVAMRPSKVGYKIAKNSSTCTY